MSILNELVESETVRVRFRDGSQLVKNESGKKAHILNVNMTCLELGDYLENLSSKTSPLKLIQIGESKVIYLSDNTPIRDFIYDQSIYAIEKNKEEAISPLPKESVQNTTQSPVPVVEKIVGGEVITEEEEEEEENVDEIVTPTAKIISNSFVEEIKYSTESDFSEFEEGLKSFILNEATAVDRLMNEKPSSGVINTLIKLIANLVKSPDVKKFKKIKVEKLRSTIGDEDLLNTAFAVFQIIGFETKNYVNGFILCEKVNKVQAENILRFLKSPWDMSPVPTSNTTQTLNKKKTIDEEWEISAKFYTVCMGNRQVRLTEEQKCNMTIKDFKEFCEIDDSEKICCGEFRELRANQTVNELFDEKKNENLSIPLRLQMRYVEDDFCPVCRVNIEETEQIATSHDCGHTLHLECAKQALEYSTSCCLCKTEWTGYDVWNPEAKELSEQKIKEIKKLAYDGYCPFSVEQVLGEDESYVPFRRVGNLRCLRGHGLQRLTFSPPCSVCHTIPIRPPLGCHLCRYAICASCQIQPSEDNGDAARVGPEDGFFSITNPTGRVTLYRVCWEFEGDDDFTAYTDGNLIQELENARRSGLVSVRWRSPRRAHYVLDVVNMTQTRIDTGTVRTIRRTERPSLLGAGMSELAGIDRGFTSTTTASDEANDDIGAEHRCPRGHILAIFPPDFRVPCGVCARTNHGYGCLICHYMKCVDCYAPSSEIQLRMKNMTRSYNLMRDVHRPMPPIDLDFPLGRPVANSTCVCCDRSFVPREADAETEIPICRECLVTNQLLEGLT